MQANSISAQAVLCGALVALAINYPSPKLFLSRIAVLVVYSVFVAIDHDNEYPTMHYFGNPRHIQSMIAYMILTEYFW